MFHKGDTEFTQSKDERIPVLLITGFLGSGKTTLLNRLIRHPSMAGSLVIINEIGEIGIDHLLVSTPTENIVLLSNGCLCCVLQGDLVTTFADVYEKRVSGECLTFDRVIVETTGLADPVPIIQTLVTDSSIAQHFRLESVITMVDGVHGELQLAKHREPVKQVVVADSLLMSKTDIASIADVNSLRSKLGQINPTAQILNAPIEVVDPRIVFPRRAGNAGAIGNDVDNWLHGSTSGYRASPSVEVGATQLRDQQSGAAHVSDLNVFTVYYDTPISGEALQLWLHMLAGFRGHDLLRVKGILNVGGSPFVVHVVQTIIGEPVRLERWPSDDRRSRLVFITRRITKSDVEGMLDELSLWGEKKRSSVSRTAIDPAVYANFVRLAARVRR
jgi:G3E family GTPase